VEVSKRLPDFEVITEPLTPGRLRGNRTGGLREEEMPPRAGAVFT